MRRELLKAIALIETNRKCAINNDPLAHAILIVRLFNALQTQKPFNRY